MSKKNIRKDIDKLSEKGSGFIKEFKEFIARGNVMDLAVGVIIGNAFSKIVTSLTDNIIMPLVGVVVGGFDFSNLSYTFKVFGRTVDLSYGIFIQNVVDFLITAFCIFVAIKFMNRFFAKKKQNEIEEEKASPKPDEVVLLEEIRDLLKEKTENE